MNRCLEILLLPARPRPALPLPLSMLLLLMVMLLLNTAPASCAPVIGRLFSTPDERAALDAQRRTGTAPVPVADPNASEGGEQAAAQPQTVTVNGIVRRSGGEATVWINQQPQRLPTQLPTRLPDQSGQAGAGVTLRAPDGAPVRLKPGQRYDPASGAVGEDDGR